MSISPPNSWALVLALALSVGMEPDSTLSHLFCQAEQNSAGNQLKPNSFLSIILVCKWICAVGETSTCPYVAVACVHRMIIRNNLVYSG